MATDSKAAFKPVTHVLFDMDGLLLDTESLYTVATQRVTQRYGKDYTWEIKAAVMGTAGSESTRIIIDRLQLPLTVEQLEAELHQMHTELFPTAQLMPGAERLVNHLHQCGVPIAVATSSKRDSFVLKTSCHGELFAKFHHIVCGGDDAEVPRGKPHPDIFLVAATKFENAPPPEKVLVFEDSPNGVLAAVAAGMQVVMVPDPRVDEDSRKSATLCLTSLEDFKPELFGLPPYNHCN
ncbi:pseudouridine-5'-phosphatase-like [Dermacentor albipictus]|uniref:pseudouridine-5'-phosphatase-like n=1 Tax=Dermacentor albipictus TaxID=60249 RepID=UPI0031FBE0C1